MLLTDIVADDKRAGEVIRRLRALFERGEAKDDPLDFNELIREVLRLLHSDFIRRNVAVATELDPRLPAVNGDRVQLPQQLTEAGCPLPIVFITGHGDVPTSVKAMRAGAFDFLTKPVDDETLLAAVVEAVEKDRRTRRAQADIANVKERLAALTPREREVFNHVVAGQLNKQIAGDLGIVEKTIKVHRSHVMEKMGARSLAELARMAERLGIATPSR